MVAPASLTPPPISLAAIAAAFGFGAAAGLLRIAAGGHYLSDVVFAALITVILVQIARRLFFPTDNA
jgi:lipid A 4'-phosphatase